MTHGGKRKGAGRPGRPTGGIRRNVYLSNEVYEYLKSTGNASAQIERLVRTKKESSMKIPTVVLYEIARAVVTALKDKAGTDPTAETEVTPELLSGLETLIDEHPDADVKQWAKGEINFARVREEGE